MGLVDYPSSDEGEDKKQLSSSSVALAAAVESAPEVSTIDMNRQSLVHSNNPGIVSSYQATYKELNRPIQGPANPFKSDHVEKKNIITGHAEEQAFNDGIFRTQHETFQSLGYAKDPTLGQEGMLVGNIKSAMAHRGQDISEFRMSKQQRAQLKRKRASKGDVAVLDGPNAFKGPWAEYKRAESSASSSSQEEEEEGGEEFLQEAYAPVSRPIIDRRSEVAPLGIEYGQEKSEFYGSSMYDYLGRTYMHVPQDLGIDLTKEPGEQECYIPKRKIHTWEGHPQGVNALRFFPKSGHLLLSCGMDAKVKLWDCYHDRELLRAYMGHNRAVKDICFTNDGTKFLSASYDRQIKLWDTETGQCISKFSSGKIPNVIKINPNSDKQNMFLVGQSDNKIVQFDMNTKEIVHEYDHHLGPVNSITFVDENRRFMTTSDDKSLRVWEWEINVPIKYIADPAQQSMPKVELHPSGNYVAAQSMDNTILVFQANNRFRQNSKKIFKGHNNAGYAIDLAFSPDGKFLMSGDTGGYAVFWDWKSCRLKGKLKAHDAPLTCIAAHPQETSKVATGGLDSKILYWD